MSDLLTAREVQDLLKVDRTTVYRMLKDGRLNGVKIGLHWRFPRAGVESLLANKPGEEIEAPRRRPQDILPLHCVQPIQNVFAEVAGVGAVTIAADGALLTNISYGCRFCELMLASESGKRACAASWRRLAENPEQQMCTCHAGLQYAHAQIKLEDEVVAVLIAGQIHAHAPNHEDMMRRARQLAAEHDIESETLVAAVAEIPVLDSRARARLTDWLQSVAETFSTIAHERLELIGRLRQIAQITHLE